MSNIQDYPTPIQSSTDKHITLVYLDSAKDKEKRGTMKGVPVKYTNMIVGDDDWRNLFPGKTVTYVADGLQSQFKRIVDEQPKPSTPSLSAQQLFDRRRGHGAFESRFKHR